MVLYFILDFLYKKKRSISSHLVSPLFSLPSSILCFPPTSNVNVFRHLHNNCSINCLFQQSSCFEQKSLKADVSNNFIFQIIRAEDHLLSLSILSRLQISRVNPGSQAESLVSCISPSSIVHPLFFYLYSVYRGRIATQDNQICGCQRSNKNEHISGFRLRQPGHCHGLYDWGWVGACVSSA